MVTDENETILKQLNAEEDRLRKTLKADADDFEELQSEWQERDSAAERNLREVEWNQYSLLQNDLSEIADAKQRLADGTYGKCEDCGGEISAKRLSVVITARKCISCQERMEKEAGIGNKSVTL